MGWEIERKFLVKDESWREGAAGERYRQGYLAIGPPASVRVRVVGDTALLNIKKSTLDIGRAEYEYPVPVEDAHEMLDTLCDGIIIEKTRYKVPVGSHLWEIDVFEGVNAGLIVAEIELDSEDETFEHPAWLGQEVSGDARYFNSSLSQHPFCDW
ncbi:MAG: CYTH domain-containing protein [Nitrospiraceae bacterium]|nr:CYTH domain-containing protein [Nitrospiraceae bacterium]